ncbi:hypothetical protein FLM48_14015 [Shewanella sp. Scap07]|uniref:hypothetical protein n=1 Tax=Shewanella sp. Scap07 TaxID=2589987 RepID=UPI0015BDEF24|nr:hypothetical protein [Shewanella sp. Scap07]QLE86082.1 hypothetical protein FLM48_14015 [Shewanella sp. Scap07]
MLKNAVSFIKRRITKQERSQYLNSFIEQCLLDASGNSRMLAKGRIAEADANMLISFPRSGNGWVRIVLGVYHAIASDKHFSLAELSQFKTYSLFDKTGIKTSVFGLKEEKEIPLDFYIPDLYQYDRLKRKRQEFLTPSIVDVTTLPIYKTHHLCPFGASYQSIGIIVREPEASVLSASLLMEPDLLSMSDAEIHEIVSYYLSAYIKYLDNYQQLYHAGKVNLIFHDTVVDDLTAWITKMYPASDKRDVKSTLSAIVTKFPLRSGFNKEIKSRVDLTLFADYQKAVELFTTLQGEG